MNKVMFKIGDYVKTPHGTGRVKCFEAFTTDGNTVYITDYIIGNRVVISLDKENTWPADHTIYDYCAYAKDLELLS